ncbi:putative bifunctional diguanylate cyclase/phosphodiesterase [Bacillus marasmi]|uniref:putative bifunctional diguanylate cyclase/phosphodiesterase n=1 Tax=Bacillus marasmi TaxID=1926279 RepID=UPI0011CAC704|nr:bifunctional diguanylate cyclase/phosphodiesterase [Bacillus marasmi]
MSKKSKYNVDKKGFLIPITIFSLIFIIICYLTINNINRVYYQHLEEMSKDLASSYSLSISKSAEATVIVNNLLQDKLLVASRTIGLYPESYSNQLFEELAATLEVDEINFFNSQGEIIFSNLKDFRGWKTHEGQPSYDFLKSNELKQVEEIRPSAESGIQYKYGYFRVSESGFIQIGVRADKIFQFLDRFEMNQLLYEMQVGGIVNQIYFIDNQNKVIGSTVNKLIGSKVTNNEVIKAINKNKEFGHKIKQNGEEMYEVFVPIYSNEKKIGTLAMIKTLNEAKVIMWQIYVTGISIVITIFTLIFFIIISTNKKNNRLVKLAYFDKLTNLPNEQYLKSYLKEATIKKGKNNAVLLVNFINFHLINEAYGYENGDDLLKEVSRKFKELEDGNMKVFRFSSEGFVFYVENYDSRESLVLIANIISHLFDTPLRIHDAELNIKVKIGISEFQIELTKIDQVLKEALISMKHIRNNDAINYAFFDEVMESKIQRERLIDKELRKSIAEENTENIYLEFQPQIDLRKDKVICFEALARMKTESNGFVSPVEFIDVAEKNQLIVPLGKLILQKACSFLRRLSDEGYEDIKVAVNISGIQILRDDFLSTVMDIIHETGVNGSNLELEITESVLMGNYQIVTEKLQILKEHNIAIALDDFGTGYSSFARIRELPIDTLKIDRYFITKITSTDDKFLLIDDIISMAHKLGLTIVAEGVELQVQKDYLLKNNCDIIQGYLFSKPISEVRSIELLREENRRSICL